MKKTVTLHFYNEEYLLPWWLEYHKTVFDHGILINYSSTDNSVNICKSICPDWDVVDSRNADFSVESLDTELTDIEKNIDGWRCSLSVSEFMVGNIERLDEEENKQLIVPTITFMDYNPTGQLDQSKPLWHQITEGVLSSRHPTFRRPRSVHNKPVEYPKWGRHWDPGLVNVNDLFIFHFGNCISTPELLARRLQIQHRIPSKDKERGFGHNHFNLLGSSNSMTEQDLKSYHRGNLAKIDNLQPFLKAFNA